MMKLFKRQEYSFEYVIVTRNSPDGLSHFVTSMMAEGWCVQGGVSTSVQKHSNGTNYEMRTHYHQTMMRRKLK